MPKRQPPRRERGSPPLAALGVFLATAAVYGARLNSPGLLEPDEARYAAVGQSMLTDRDLVTPRFNGLIYLDKPPLLHWLTAASLAAFGRQEFAVRLSSVLAAAAGVALIYAFGRHVHGHRAGLASALVLASTVMWFGVGRVIRYDMLLALSIAATLWWAYLASELGRQGRGYYCLAAAAAGLGVLAKGPVAVGLPGLVFVAYLASTRRLRVLLDVPWPACLGILGGIAIPWFVLCERANPGAVRFFLVHENLLRVKGETNPTHWEPWWYFLAVFPGACLPWTLFLPGAVHSGATASGPGEEGNRRACRLWLLWLVATLLLFSVPRAKLMAYVLPAVPPAALLVGRHLSPACRGGRWAALITGLLLVSGAFAWVTIGARAAAKQGVPGEVLIPAMAGCWLVGGLAAAFLAAFRHREYAFVALAGAALGTYHLAIWAAGLVPASPSDKALARAVAEVQAPGERIFCARKLSRGAVFYLNEHVDVFGRTPEEYDFPGNVPRLGGRAYPLEQAAAVLAAGPPALVICRDRHLEQFRAVAGNTVRPVRRIGRYVILRSVPAKLRPSPEGGRP